MSDEPADRYPSGLPQRERDYAVSGVSTVARTQDTVTISAPLLTSAENLAGILCALGSAAKLIGHISERETDLILTFRTSPARTPTLASGVPTAGEPLDESEPPVPAARRTAVALSRSKIPVPQHRIVPKERHGQSHVEIPFGALPAEIAIGHMHLHNRPGSRLVLVDYLHDEAADFKRENESLTLIFDDVAEGEGEES